MSENTSCANCTKPVLPSDSMKLQCDGCKRLIHVTCTDLPQDDRVTRRRVKCLKVLCNSCGANLEASLDIKGLIESFKNDIRRELEDVKLKIETLNEKLTAVEGSAVENSKSVQSSDVVIQEVLDRLNRAKNVFIRGVPELAGDVNAGRKHDGSVVTEVLNTVNCPAKPITIFRVGKPNVANKYPRMIKLVMPSEHDARTILRNKKNLIGKSSTSKLSIISDQTPSQVQLLNRLRGELDARKANGEPNLTIKYIHGVPKIISTNFRTQDSL